MNRRCFLQRAQGAAALAAAAGLGLSVSGCIGFYYAQGTLRGTEFAVALHQFGDGRFLLVDVPRFALPLYLFRGEDGEVTAVSTRCMHRGCQVEPVRGHLVCPCHGSEYENTGAVLKGPTREALRRYPTRQEGGVVLIDVSTGEAT